MHVCLSKFDLALYHVRNFYRVHALILQLFLNVHLLNDFLTMFVGFHKVNRENFVKKKVFFYYYFISLSLFNLTCQSNTMFVLDIDYVCLLDT